jgi:glycosyltransferase involved in cell wall biosynthesis
VTQPAPIARAHPASLRVTVVVVVGPPDAEHPGLAEGLARVRAEVSAHPSAELVVVDDGGGPAVRAAAGALRGRVRVVHEPRSLGTRRAQADGLGLASGDVLLLADPLQPLGAGWIDALCRPFTSDPGVGMVEAIWPAQAGAVEPAEAGAGLQPGVAVAVAIRATALESVGGAELVSTAPGDPVPGGAGPAGAGPVVNPLLAPSVTAELAAGRWRTAQVPGPGATRATPGWGGDPAAVSGTTYWDPPRLPESSARGLNVVGLLEAACGIGDAGRRYVEAAETASVPVATFAFHLHGSPWLPHHRRGDGTFAHDTTLVVLNPELLPSYTTLGGAELWAGRYTVGMWFWEVDRIASHHQAGLGFVSELWVSSEFLRTTFVRHTDKPVVHIPLPVPARPGSPPGDRRALGLPDAFTFLTAFDYGSLEARKNALGTIEAFRTAFAPGEGPVLVVKTTNPHFDPDGPRRLRAAASGRRDVVFLEQHVTDAQLGAMIAHADCYVSLHRSEGFGLAPAEAMAWGRPVVATAYSGTLDFMTDANSYLVPFDLVDVPPTVAGSYPSGSRWAEPRIDAAGEALRSIWDDRSEARARGARGRDDIRRTHSPEAAGRAMADRLEEIDRALGRRPPVDDRPRGAARRPGRPRTEPARR